MLQDQRSLPVEHTDYVNADSDINFIDLWFIIVKHKRIFILLFGVALVIGVAITLSLPKKYAVTTAIEIGQVVIDGKTELLESPETIKAKLDNALIPVALQEYDDATIKTPKVNVSIPKNSQLVVVQSKVSEELIDLAVEIQKKLVVGIEKEHERILKPTKLVLEADISKVKFDLQQLRDKRFFEPKVKGKEVELKQIKTELAKLEDATIQALQIKTLETSLDREKKHLASMREEAAVLASKKKRIMKISELLVVEIKALKSQIDKASELRISAASDIKDGPQAMAMLMIDNELQQNRKRLSDLEERLYIDLENQSTELQKKINDNKRDQFIQAAVIVEKQKTLEKYNSELKLEREMLKSEIDKLVAESEVLPAEREQSIDRTQEKLSQLEEQLDSIILTKAVSPPSTSHSSVGLSDSMKMGMSIFLALLAGLVGVVLSEFASKVRIRRLASDSGDM